MRRKSQFIRAILERSSLAMAMMALLVATGILLSGTSADDLLARGVSAGR